MKKLLENQSVGIGILSWHAHETLKNSLDSYPKSFLETFDQKIIYFSDITDADREIARIYGWECVGGKNEGIAGGMKRLAQALTTDYALLLQNDNPLCEPNDLAVDHIKKAVSILNDGHADLARMRHRWNVGDDFACVSKYLKYFDVSSISPQYMASPHNHPDTRKKPLLKSVLRLIKPSIARRLKGRCIFIEDKPAQLYPDIIHDHDDFMVIDSSALDFTDQCLLIARDKWLDVFMPYVEANPSKKVPNGFQAPELCINTPWWRQRPFKILQGNGIFTHARFDGSFRPEHHTKMSGGSD